MFYLNLRNRNIKNCKSGHQMMQVPIMLYLKALGIRTAPPGNSYKYYNIVKFIKLSITE